MAVLANISQSGPIVVQLLIGAAQNGYQLVTEVMHFVNFTVLATANTARHWI
jgi:hypothetical protein